jgi:hypothetical protein
MIIESPAAPRLESLDLVPSPYLSGLMDKFFDDVLIPLVHTTRGCPFTCTFCTEGARYYSKVAQAGSLDEELKYIAQRVGTVTDVCLSDANFGMFNQDLAKAEAIAEVRAEYGWPKRVIVSTGKNQKERVIKVAEVLEGALSVTASLQSTDAEVLRQINRANISIEALRGMVDSARDADTTTYTELILGLPSDTAEKHLNSLRDVANAGLGVVRIYQLILLPQTEMSTPASRAQNDFVTRFRINPRCFGIYDILGVARTVVEHEEIVVGTTCLSVDEYLDCRELDLSVEIFHNSGLFSEFASIFRFLGVDWFDVILEAHRRVKNSCTNELRQIYDKFRAANLSGTFQSRADLVEFVNANIRSFLLDTDGTNEMATAKAKALSESTEELIEIACESVVRTLGRAGLLDESMARFVSEFKEVLTATRVDILKMPLEVTIESSLDLDALEAAKYEIDPREIPNVAVQTYAFEQSPEQVAFVTSLGRQYDLSTIDGIGRIFMRTNPRTLFPSRTTVNTTEAVSG